MEKHLLIISSDVGFTSAQGVRYRELFSDFGIHSQKTILSLSSPNNYIADAKSATCFDYSGGKMIAFLARFVLKIARRLAHYMPFYDVNNLALPFFYRRLGGLLRAEKIHDVVICVTPFSMIKLARHIKKKYRVNKLVLDMSDPYSFNMVISGASNVARRSRLERECFQYFDKIVVVSQQMADEYRRLHPMYAGKFSIVEQGVDEGFIEKVISKSTHEKEGGIYKFLYAGGFYRKGRNPSELYRAFGAHKESCRLYVYGNIRKSLRPVCLENIVYHKAVDKDQLVRVTAQADALILMDNEFGFQVPGKTIETLASGKPVLFIYANDESPTLSYVREAKGVVWAKNNVTDIAMGIERIINGDYEEPQFDFRPYTWEKMRNKYEILLEGTDR